MVKITNLKQDASKTVKIGQKVLIFHNVMNNCSGDNK